MNALTSINYEIISAYALIRTLLGFLSPLVSRRLTHRGPDGVDLGENLQSLTLNVGTDGKLRHLTLTDDDGIVLVEMSGEIVLDVDEHTAAGHGWPRSDSCAVD